MKPTVILLALALTASAGAAEARGCLKGAVVGGVAGHFAHHHAVLGAMAGCAVGHHYANKKYREEHDPHYTPLGTVRRPNGASRGARNARSFGEVALQ